MTVTRPIRKWEVFPGKNKFFCNGLIITTDQPSIFLLTNFLLFGVTALFYGFDCPYLFRKLSPSIPFVDVAVFIFVVIFLYKASFMDPGIIPRATPQEALYIERMMDFPQSGQSIAYQPPRILDITVKGVATKVKYCSTCKFFRPPRVSHCSTCDNCVERFDHHCPWVGNCIGKRNYRFFYWFVITLTIHCCYVFAFSLTTMILISVESDFLNALKTSPGSVIEIVVSFVCLWSFVGLAGFHTFLSFCNITTNEDIKSSYTRGQKNPFSLDSKLSNFCFMIFGPVTPSLIDRRGFVKTDCVPTTTTTSQQQQQQLQRQHQHQTTPTSTVTAILSVKEAKVKSLNYAETLAVLDEKTQSSNNSLAINNSNSTETISNNSESCVANNILIDPGNNNNNDSNNINSSSNYNNNNNTDKIKYTFDNDNFKYNMDNNDITIATHSLVKNKANLHSINNNINNVIIKTTSNGSIMTSTTNNANNNNNNIHTSYIPNIICQTKNNNSLHIDL